MAEWAEAAAARQAEVTRQAANTEVDNCAECGVSGHRSSECVVTDRNHGSIKSCPACNTRPHSLDSCIRMAQGSLKDWEFISRVIELLLVCRGNKPPIQSATWTFYDILALATKRGLVDDDNALAEEEIYRVILAAMVKYNAVGPGAPLSAKAGILLRLEREFCLQFPYLTPSHPQAKMDNSLNAAMADLAQQATTLATAMGYVRGVMEQLESGGEIPPLGLANRLEKKFSSLHEEWAELVVKAQFIPTLEAKLQASLEELATEKEAALKQRAAVDAEIVALGSQDGINAKEAELDSRSANATTRDAELGRLSVSLDRRAAALDTLDALIQERMIALQGQETAMSANAVAMDAREKAVRDRETILTSQEAEIHTRIGDLQSREALVANTLADLENRKASSERAFAKAMADLDSRENQLASKVADLKAQEARLAEKTMSIESRETQFKNMTTALESRETQLKDMTAALESRETRLKDMTAALESGETQLTGRAADLHMRETQLTDKVAAIEARAAQLRDETADIESRETRVANKAVDIESWKTQLTDRAAKLDRQEVTLADRASSLDAANEALKKDQRAVEDQRVGIWVARSTAADEISALQKLKATLQGDQKVAADRAAAAEGTLLRIDELCSKLNIAALTRVDDLCAKLEDATLAGQIGSLSSKLNDPTLANRIDNLSLKLDEATLASRIDDLCLRLAGCSTEAAQSPGLMDKVEKLTVSIQKIHDRMSSMSNMVCSSSDVKDVKDAVDAASRESAKQLELLRVAVESTAEPSNKQSQEISLLESVRASFTTAVSDLEARFPRGLEAGNPASQPTDSQGTLSNPGDHGLVSRKRRRRESADDQSDWSRFVSAVADDMDALSPQEIEPGELGPRTLYYELGILALRESYKRSWDEFVRSDLPTYGIVSAPLSPQRDRSKSRRTGIATITTKPPACV